MTTREDEVDQFKEEEAYAEEEYPEEEDITVTPWDKFKMVERNQSCFYSLQGGQIDIIMRQAMPEEVPEDDDVFWANGDGKETPRDVSYTCTECGETFEMTVHTQFDPPDVNAPCKECNERQVFELSDDTVE